MVTREEQRAQAAGLVVAVAQEMGDDWSVTTVGGWPVMVGPERERIRGIVGWYGPERKRLVLEGLWPSVDGGDILWAAQGVGVSLSVMLSRVPGQTHTSDEIAADVRRRLLPRYLPTLHDRLKEADAQVARWVQAKELRSKIAEAVRPIGATRIDRTQVVTYNPATTRPDVTFEVLDTKRTVSATVTSLTPGQAQALAEFLTTL